MIWRLLVPVQHKYVSDVLPVSIAIRRWNEQMEAEGKDDERISTELPRYPKIDGKPVSMKDYETYAREAGQYSYNALKDRKFPETMTPRHAKMIEEALKRGRKIALFRLKKRLAEKDE